MVLEFIKLQRQALVAVGRNPEDYILYLDLELLRQLEDRLTANNLRFVPPHKLHKNGLIEVGGMLVGCGGGEISIVEAE